MKYQAAHQGCALFVKNMSEVEYTIRKSRRVKKIRLAVHIDGSVVLTLPFGVSKDYGERLVLEREEWIKEKQKYFQEHHQSLLPRTTRQDYLRHKEKARRLAAERVRFFNRGYDFKFNRIFIRDAKTRWGSCSGDGNLNFSWKIILLPPHLADYLVVHELCHLWEFNHSKAFWELVAKAVPEWRACRRELRKYI